jgi:Flp pilus assembly protein TadG
VRTIQDEKAQGVIEFALMFSVLMLLFLGTVDYARFLYYDTAIRSAARVGAETASNHCPLPGCSSSGSPVADAYVAWQTTCSPQPYVTLQPQYTPCQAPAGASSTWTPACSTNCTNCTYDVCINPAAGSRSQGTQVTVTVGYSFKPLTFLMDQFFPEQSCFTGDSTATNHHTLCAASVGRVS